MLDAMTPEQYYERMALKVLENREVSQGKAKAPQNSSDVDKQLDNLTRLAGF